MRLAPSSCMEKSSIFQIPQTRQLSQRRPATPPLWVSGLIKRAYGWSCLVMMMMTLLCRRKESEDEPSAKSQLCGTCVNLVFGEMLRDQRIIHKQVRPRAIIKHQTRRSSRRALLWCSVNGGYADSAADNMPPIRCYIWFEWNPIRLTYSSRLDIFCI